MGARAVKKASCREMGHELPFNPVCAETGAERIAMSNSPSEKYKKNLVISLSKK
jgi:hypothetical protein